MVGKKVSENGKDPAKGRTDFATLRFGLGFPILLSLAFAVSALGLAKRLPNPVAFVWNTGGGIQFTSLAGYVTISMAAIIFPALPFLIGATRTTQPVLMRRILLSGGLAVSLFICTVAAAGLAGQFDLPDARLSHPDTLVLLLGSGGSLGLALLVHYIYHPASQWDPADDRALQRELAFLRFPALAQISEPFWSTPRASVVIMTLLVVALPGGLLAILSPWITLALAVLALALLGLVLFRIRISEDGLSIRLAGLVPMLRIDAPDIVAARAAEVSPGDYGGWGPRRGPLGRSYLSRGGAGVVLQTVGGDVTFSVLNQDVAQRAAAALNQVGGATESGADGAGE